MKKIILKLKKIGKLFRRKLRIVASLGGDCVVILRLPDGSYDKPLVTRHFEGLLTEGVIDLKSVEAVHHLSSRREQADVLQLSSQPPAAFETYPLKLRRQVVSRLVDALVTDRKQLYPFDPNGNGDNQRAVATEPEEVYRLFVEGDQERGLAAHPCFTVPFPARGVSKMPSEHVNQLFSSMVKEVRFVRAAAALLSCVSGAGRKCCAPWNHILTAYCYKQCLRRGFKLAWAWLRETH